MASLQDSAFDLFSSGSDTMKQEDLAQALRMAGKVISNQEIRDSAQQYLINNGEGSTIKRENFLKLCEQEYAVEKNNKSVRDYLDFLSNGDDIKTEDLRQALAVSGEVMEESELSRFLAIVNPENRSHIKVEDMVTILDACLNNKE